MTEHQAPVAIAHAFTEAWTSRDFTTAAGYLADDVIFDGPINHSTGAKDYLQGLTAFAQTVTGLKILAVLGDDAQALIMYEVTTGPFGILTCAEHLTVHDGQI